MANQFDVVVIGAGQAGLAMGYFLQKSSLSFTLLDSFPRAGESWRRRYDSLVLFTPRAYSDLPGLPFPGERMGLPTKDDVADYLEQYAAYFSLPIQYSTCVEKVEKRNNMFCIRTNAGDYQAKKVVIATGPFSAPYVPKIAEDLSEDLLQIHTSQYKNPEQLREGHTLVVGAGNSGAQITVELAERRQVLFSTGAPRVSLPIMLFGKSIFWYFEKTGMLSVHADSRIGSWLSKQPDPLFGYGYELKKLTRTGKLKQQPRVVSANGTQITFENGENAEVQNIIWATGFRPDYSWIRIEGILDHTGKPIHHRGISPVQNLFFLGLPWQYTRGSALLGGVGEDAKYLMAKIQSDFL